MNFLLPEAISESKVHSEHKSEWKSIISHYRYFVYTYSISKAAAERTSPIMSQL